MAEKYGTVPKKFTPAWWEYFWMYYKVYVIIAVFVIIAAAVTIYQLATVTKYDFSVAYAGNSTFTEEMSDELTSSLASICKDIDGDGEKNIDFTQINLGTEDATYNAAMQNKFMLTLSEEDVYLYILEEKVADVYISSKDESNFIPAEDWFDKDMTLLSTYKKDGVVFGIELTDCEMFREIAKKTNADFSGNYLFVRYYPRPSQEEKQAEGHKVAMELAKKIVTGN